VLHINIILRLRVESFVINALSSFLSIEDEISFVSKRSNQKVKFKTGKISINMLMLRQWNLLSFSAQASCKADSKYRQVEQNFGYLCNIIYKDLFEKRLKKRKDSN